MEYNKLTGVFVGSVERYDRRGEALHQGEPDQVGGVGDQPPPRGAQPHQGPASKDRGRAHQGTQVEKSVRTF